MDPTELAADVGIAPAALRTWLRRTYRRPQAARGERWVLTAEQVAAARQHFDPASRPAQRGQQTPETASRDASDETYVIDLCDEVLDECARRQHRFDWLLGDPGVRGARVALPVDAYYPGHGLVVEYRELQHDEPVAHFDKPDTLTVSGVHRGEQRRIYDARRDQLIPAHGLRLVVVRPRDLASNSRGRLTRVRDGDLQSLHAIHAS